MAADSRSPFLTSLHISELSNLGENLTPEHLKIIIDSAPIACFILDINASITYANKKSSELYGYSKEEFLDLNIAHLFRGEEDRENLFEEYTSHVATGQVPRSFVGKTMSKEGKEIFVKIHWALLQDGNKNILGVATYVEDLNREDFKVKLNDISELFLKNRKDLLKANSIIQHERSMAQRYLDIANVTITIIDTNNELVMINKAGCELLEYEEGEIVGKNWFDCFVPTDDQMLLRKEFRRLLKSGDELSKFENQVVTRSGKKKTILWNNTVLKDQKGEVMGILSSGQDITQIRDFDKELVRAKSIAEEANQAKSQFLAEMSHEIRNPLNSIVGVSDLLEETNLSEEQKEYVEIFKRSSETLLSLVNEILDLSKIESKKVRLEENPFSLDELVENILVIVKEKALAKDIELSMKLGENVPKKLIGDASKIHQILLNLVGNAVKFTDKAGSISVKVDYTSINPNKTILQFEISDTGIGIPKNKLASLFRDFTQVSSKKEKNYGGTGLGLAIAKRLVEIMKGEIWCESTEGEGSTFFFKVPLTVDLRNPFTELNKIKDFKKFLEKHEEEEDKQVEGECKQTLLVVDDSADNRVLVKAYLKNSPLKIVEATNGKEALKIFRERHIDIILMDAQMPVMDGYDATTAIRHWEVKTGRETPATIIMISAYAFESEIKKSMDCGSNVYITKPVKKDKLLSTIYKSCNNKTCHSCAPKKEGENQ